MGSLNILIVQSLVISDKNLEYYECIVEEIYHGFEAETSQMSVLIIYSHHKALPSTT